MSLFFEGIAAGFAIAAPVGAIGFLCIQQTLRGGIKLGLISGLGAATADTIYGILVAIGATAAQFFLLQYKIPLTISGGLFLCYLGIKKFLSTPPNSNAIKIIKPNLLHAYVVTFLLTLTNPATIIDFIALFTSLNINTSSYQNSLLFVAGVFIGSAAWWLLLSSVVGIFRHKISTRMLQYINYIAGIVIFSFGIYALLNLIK